MGSMWSIITAYFQTDPQKITLVLYFVCRKQHFYIRQIKNSPKQQDMVEFFISQEQLNEEQLRQGYEHKNSPQWEQKRLSPAQIEKMLSIVGKNCEKKISSYMCSISDQLMKEPCTMKCCFLNPQIVKKHAQRKILEKEIQRQGKCPFCKSETSKSRIDVDEDKSDAIQNFKTKVLKILLILSPVKYIQKGLIEQEDQEEDIFQALTHFQIKKLQRLEKKRSGWFERKLGQYEFELGQYQPLTGFLI